MKQSIEEHIKKLEEKLRNAMLSSDISELDKLISPELIFTNHLGQLMTKEDDINSHKLGTLKFEKIELSEQQVKICKNFSIVSVKANISCNFGGTTFEDILRFTRIWEKKSEDSWQLTVGHSSIIS